MRKDLPPLFFVWVLPLLLSTVSPSHAYTFFVEETPPQTLRVSYWPYQQGPVPFWVDADPFVLEELRFSSLVQLAFQYWTQASGTALRVQLHTLPLDIDASNIAQSSRIDDQRPDILLEHDGKILESLGLDAEYVLGIGVPIVEQNQQGALTGPFGGKIVDALVLINTARLPKAARLQRLLIHEIGHALGIGHTNVVHLPNAEKLPAMFFDTGVQQSLPSPHADDIAAISSLYPNPDYEQHYGAIEGQVQRADRTPVFGAVVIAEPTDGSAPIAAWSDPDGRFGLYGLPPNTYTLHTRALSGDRFLFSMDPALHVGGIYKKATRSFCPESYNDLPFLQCRIQPTQSTPLTVRAGQRQTGLIIREDQGNPSPALLCRLGASPQLPEHPARFPPEVPNQGLRNTICPPDEPPQENLASDASEPFAAERAEPPPEMSSLEAPDQKPELTDISGCRCGASPSWPSSWLALLLLLALRSRRRGRNIRNISRWSAFVLCLFLPSVPWALTVRKPSFTMMAQRAQTVVRARAIAQNTLPSQPLPLLRTTFSLVECLKGPCPQTFSLSLPAPRYGRYRLFTSGIPRFSLAQEYILFVRPNHRQKPILVGLSFGVFDVQPDPQQHLRSRGCFFAPLPLATFRRLLDRALHPRSRATSQPTPRSLPTSRPRSHPTPPMLRTHHTTTPTICPLRAHAPTRSQSPLRDFGLSAICAPTFPQDRGPPLQCFTKTLDILRVVEESNGHPQRRRIRRNRAQDHPLFF